MSKSTEKPNKQIIDPNSDTLPVIWLDQLLETPTTPQPTVLSPWLPEQGLAMIYAKRGIGKTFLALGIAYTIATGGTLLNWRATKARSVLYIDGEMTSKRLAERLAALVKADKSHHSKIPLGFLTPDKLGGNTPVELARQLKTTSDLKQRQVLIKEIMTKTKMIDLADNQDQARLLPSIDEFDVIIVDNISTLCPGTKENEADTWVPVQHWAITMRTLGKTVLFVHHAGKSGTQRGTSKREDILDTVITLKPNKEINHNHLDDTSMSGACFDIHFEKARGFYGEDAKPFRAELITCANGSQYWQHQAIRPNIADRVATLKTQGHTHQHIANEIGISKATVSRYLRKPIK